MTKKKQTKKKETKKKETKLTPFEVNKRHKQKAYGEARKRFLDAQEEVYGPKDWQYDSVTRKHFIDDGKMYDGTQRKFCLVEIHEGAGPGFSPFPNMGFILFVRGQQVMSDSNEQRLKQEAIKMI